MVGRHMAQVRAKFTVSSITRRQSTVLKDGRSVNQEVQTVEMWPVTGTCEENKSFFASTPNGKIELRTIHPNQFELNKTYYVDFTAAD